MKHTFLNSKNIFIDTKRTSKANCNEGGAEAGVIPKTAQSIGSFRGRNRHLVNHRVSSNQSFALSYLVYFYVLRSSKSILYLTLIKRLTVSVLFTLKMRSKDRL